MTTEHLNYLAELEQRIVNNKKALENLEESFNLSFVLGDRKTVDGTLCLIVPGSIRDVIRIQLIEYLKEDIEKVEQEFKKL